MGETVRRVGSGGPWEDAVGYSRVVRAGPHVWVAGCTGVDEHGVVVGGGPGAQARQALANVRAALARVDATLEDVVRTRIFVTDIAAWQEVGRAHGEALTHVRPAATMVEVAALIDPAMAVEIEVDAYVAG